MRQDLGLPLALSPVAMWGRLGEKFEVLGEIGRGGFGIVFEARDLVLDRRVAIKVLREDRLAPEELPRMREKFRAEARSAAHLNHPNIVSIFEAGLEGKTAYIVMEHVEGSSLSALIREHGPMAVPDVLRLAERLLSALAYAHAHGIVHRDIKPGNLLIRKDGVLKLTDFGLAKAIEAAPGDATLSGIVVGTPGFVSPEQLRAGRVDVRSDVFSAAACLYHALCGEGPFEAPSPVESLMRTLHGDPVDLAERGVVAPVSVAIRRALAKEPGERFQRVESFAEALGVGEHRHVVPGADETRWRRPAGLGAPQRSGSMETVEPPQLLLTLWRHGFDGLVVVESGGIEMGLDFVHGQLLGISGGPPETLLGRILRAADRLTEEQCAGLLARRRAPALLGELAVQAGLVRGDQLLEALAIQFDRRLRVLLRTPWERFDLYASARGRDWQGLDHPALEVEMARILRTDAGARCRYVLPFLGAHEHARVELAPEAAEVLLRFHLEPRFQRWLRFAGGTALEAALASSVVSRPDAEVALYLLWAAGVVALSPGRPGAAVPRAAEHVPRVEIIPRHATAVSAEERPPLGSPAARAAAAGLLARALEAERLEGPARARPLLLEARDLDPRSTFVALELAWNTFRTSAGEEAELRQAALLFEQVHRAEPANVSAIVGLAKAARLSRDHSTAWRYLAEAQAICPRDGEVRREVDLLSRAAASDAVHRRPA